MLSHRWIDPGLLERLERWESTCNSRHAGLCKGVPQESLRRIRPTWLIDVKPRCVIPAPENCSFVALSYVWGNQSTVQATFATMGHLQRVGALSNMPIAKRIEHAMSITELLDGRYLWVDTLCILQDDESQQHIEMSKLAAIYANYAITTLAVEGRHANSGLKGFHGISEASNLCQSFHRLAEGTKIILFPMGPNQLELGTHQTDWETRGWTYQEHFFSLKRLVFDGDSVRWECTAAIWREHVESDLDFEPQFNDAFSCEALFKPSFPDLSWFNSILRDYNRRNFTYPEDGLLAFDGIAFLVSQTFPGSFISGLPVAFFEIVLLWQPYERITRRISRCPEAQYRLPSWSWAG